MTGSPGHGDRGPPRRRFLAGAAAAASLPIAGCTGVLGGGSGPEASTLPASGDPDLLEGVETYPSEGADHVAQGTRIDYARTPPLSGPHYPSPLDVGFYEQPQALGNLIHSLEHGAVVVYYRPSALTEEIRTSLNKWVRNHTDPWASVIAVPFPADDPQAPFALTAWRRVLRMEEYDVSVVRAFCAEYLGRGPENPVRTTVSE